MYSTKVVERAAGSAPSKNARTKPERAYCVVVVKRSLSVLLTLLLTKITRTLSVLLIFEQLNYIYRQTLKTLKTVIPRIANPQNPQKGQNSQNLPTRG